MKQVAILVEGQTEEQFVVEILRPYLRPDDFWLVPIVVSTSTNSAGLKFRGGGTWKNYDLDLRKLIRQPHWFKIGLLVDYYAYPANAPGSGSPGQGRSRHAALCSALSAEYADPRFVPGIALHEFETWVIAAAVHGDTTIVDRSATQKLRKLVHEFRNEIESINDGPSTAPSKRIKQAWPSYSKVVDGINVVREAGLDQVLSSCPTLGQWIERLRAPLD